jgi:hypothetical protein
LIKTLFGSIHISFAPFQFLNHPCRKSRHIDSGSTSVVPRPFSRSFRLSTQTNVLLQFCLKVKNREKMKFCDSFWTVETAKSLAWKDRSPWQSTALQSGCPSWYCGIRECVSLANESNATPITRETAIDIQDFWSCPFVTWNQILGFSGSGWILKDTT